MNILPSVSCVKKLKKCAGLVPIAADRAEVLHDQVQFLYNPETIVDPLTELVAHLAMPEMPQFCLPNNDDDGLDQFVTSDCRC